MIVLNKEMAFISFYLAEKEYFLPDRLREALSFIYYLNKLKGKDKALAIHKTNEKYKKDYQIDYEKPFLWKKYRARLAHIKNAKDKYYKWGLKLREVSMGIKKLCECGCGQEVTNKKNRFIHGHHRRLLSQEEKELNAKRMRDARASKNDNKVINFKSYKNDRKFL
jgi:hypothetical protein